MRRWRKPKGLRTGLRAAGGKAYVGFESRPAPGAERQRIEIPLGSLPALVVGEFEC